MFCLDMFLCKIQVFVVTRSVVVGELTRALTCLNNWIRWPTSHTLTRGYGYTCFTDKNHYHYLSATNTKVGRRHVHDVWIRSVHSFARLFVVTMVTAESVHISSPLIWKGTPFHSQIHWTSVYILRPARSVAARSMPRAFYRFQWIETIWEDAYIRILLCKGN